MALPSPAATAMRLLRGASIRPSIVTWPSIVLLLAIALLTTGCLRRRGTTASGRMQVSARQERQLRRQSARELGCPEAALALTALSDRVYQVHGCGQLRDYALGPGRRRGWYALQPVYARASSEMACPVEQLQIAAPAATMRSAAGCGRTARYDLVCGAVECAWLMTAHGGAWAGEQAAVAVAAPPASPTPIVVTASTSEDDLVIPEPPAAGSPEAVLRAAIDAQRAAIQRCASTSTVRVHASWSADGAVTLALEPPLADSAAETCVRTAVGAQRVAAGVAGELVHTIL